MKEILILLIAFSLLDPHLAFGPFHKTSINRSQAFRNTLNFMQTKLTNRAQTAAARTQAQFNAQNRNLRISFDKEAQQSRKVHMRMVQNRLLKDISSITIGRMRDQMTNMSRNLQRCFDDEFSKDPEEIAAAIRANEDE